MAFGAQFQIRASDSGWQVEGMSFAIWDLLPEEWGFRGRGRGTLESLTFLPRVFIYSYASKPPEL